MSIDYGALRNLTWWLPLPCIAWTLETVHSETCTAAMQDHGRNWRCCRAEKSMKITQPEHIGNLPGRCNGPMWIAVKTEKGLCGAWLEKETINL